jgi:GT2 family glycosyltransferase/glycosyltransferase involved in cell wall biosynthesis
VGRGVERARSADRVSAWRHDRPDVVFFSIVPWGDRWQRPHQFAAQLARRGHRVVYVTPHFLVGGEPWRELAEDSVPEGVVLAELATQARDTVHRIDDWSHDDLAHAHHTFWRVVDALRLRCPILMVETPAWWPLISWIRERTDFPVVYDCLDEHTGWNQAGAATLRAWEESLASAADLVLGSAAALVERLSAFRDDVVLVPNGCDVDHFAPAREPNGVLRPPLSGPIVGYYGAVSAGWFDTGLLLAVARSRPDWNMVVIGPVDSETQALLDGSQNILQLGEVPYAELPRYCADFDVGIIPFLVNDLTAATDPVKLYEYFAAGKPVVTTPLPELYPLQGPLLVADTPSAFERAVDSFLREPGNGDRRRAIAREASWSNRVDLFYGRMLDCLPSLDVVVLTHDTEELTRRCLQSVAADSSYEPMVIVVDNASADETRSLLESMSGAPRTRVILNEANLGFSAGLNQGVRAGSGRYVLLLNNDTELPRGALLAFVNALARSRDTGLVGAVTNSIGNEAEIYTPYDIEQQGALDAWFQELAWERFGLRFDIPVLALFATISRREDLDAAGGIPEHYQVGMFEDDELAERVRALGKRVVCAEDVYVHHAGGAAFRTLDPVVYKAIFDRNRRVFEQVVGHPWRPHTYRPDKRIPVAPAPESDVS